MKDDKIFAVKEGTYKNKKKTVAHLIKLNKEKLTENNTKKSLEQFCKDLQGILY